MLIKDALSNLKYGKWKHKNWIIIYNDRFEGAQPIYKGDIISIKEGRILASIPHGTVSIPYHRTIAINTLQGERLWKRM